MLLSTAIDEYLEMVKASRRPRTFESANYILGKLKDKYPDRPFEEFRGADLTRYVSNLPYSNRTKANVHIRIGAMLRHFDVDLKKFKAPRPRFTVSIPQVYEEKELEKFFCAARDDFHSFVYFKTLLLTGMRDMEAMWIEWSDYKDTGRGPYLHIRPKPPNFVPKTHEERQIPVVSQDLQRLLSQLRGQRPGTLIFPTKSGLANWHALRMCKRIAKRAGMDETKWSLHGFRRTFCTNCFRAGLDTRTVMALMGHKDIESTLRYWRALEGQQLRDKMSAVFA